jgi:hypothetical protein
MGIELYSQILSLNNARRCRLSKSQLVPSGAKLKVGSTNSCSAHAAYGRSEIRLEWDSSCSFR